MVYQDRPPVFDSPSEDACFCKSPEREYEKEWRCVRTFAPSEDRLISIDPTLITEIILGFRLEPWNVSRIMQCVEPLNINPALFLSSPSHSERRFVNTPKELSLCEHCAGNVHLMTERH